MMLDYFESPASKPMLARLLMNGTEEGGIMLAEKGKISYHLIPNTANGGKENNEYHYANIVEIYPHMGDIHSHPRGRHDGDYAGPSGSETSLVGVNDIAALCRLVLDCPGAIDTVVSILSEKDGRKRCNVDAYFVWPLTDKNAYKKEKDPLRFCVIDLGIYDYETPPTK
jgi:hypothetical protein